MLYYVKLVFHGDFILLNLDELKPPEQNLYYALQNKDEELGLYYLMLLSSGHGVMFPDNPAPTFETIVDVLYRMKKITSAIADLRFYFDEKSTGLNSAVSDTVQMADWFSGMWFITWRRWEAFYGD